MLIMMTLPADIAAARGGRGHGPTATNETIESLVADFVFDIPECPLCEGVTFTDRSSGGVPPYTYDWDFGDGSNSTEENPAHHYADYGNYTVTLTVTDSASDVATTSKIITLDPAPEEVIAPLSSSPTKAATGSWPRCISGCTANDVEILDVRLDIPTGNYTLGQAVTGNVTMDLYFHRQNTYCIVVVADLYEGGLPKQTDWVSTIIDYHGGGGSQTYSMGMVSWTYGKLFEMNNVLVQWSQNSPSGGVCPTDCSQYGSPSKCSQVTNVIVLTPLVADFEFNNVCYCNNTTFTDTTTGGEQPYISWDWDFGDGSGHSGAQNATHHYTSYGTYAVTLTVTDGAYSTDSESHNAVSYTHLTLPTSDLV